MKDIGAQLLTHAIPIMGHERVKDSAFMDADYAMNLPLSEVTLAEAFQVAGYATSFMGKWHVCWNDEYYPDYEGFETNVGDIKMGHPGDCFNPDKGNWRMKPEHEWTKMANLRGRSSWRLSLRLHGRRSREIHRVEKGSVLPLYLSHYAAHTPIQAKPELIEKYRNKPIGATDRLALAEDTLIVFTFDNGGAEHVGESNPTSDRPWHGMKGSTSSTNTPHLLHS